MFTKHHEKVRLLQQQLASSSGSFSLQNHPHPSNITRSPSYKSNASKLNINAFDQILEIDPVGRRIVVEPRVTMEQLARATLPHHMMVPVIPEFKGITVGGAVMGAGMESASHRYGLFSDNCLAYEILLGDGSVVRATPNDHSDLFYGIVGSYGSLGVLLSIELRLIPATPTLQLRYLHFKSIPEALHHLQHTDAHFIEGFVFAPDHLTLAEGRFSSAPSSRKHLWSPWFYAHAKKVPHGHEESICLIDYLFRHDRGAFWIGAYGTHWTSIPRYFLESRLRLPSLAKLLPSFNPEGFKGPADPGLFFRLFCGWAMTSHRLYAWLHSHSEEWTARHFIIQDCCIPSSHAAAFIQNIIDRIKIFPLWLCPTPSTATPQIFSPHHLSSPSVVNVGVYGISPTVPSRAGVRLLEEWTHSAQGRKVLYSHSYYTPDEFWSIYPKKEYDHLRRSYHADRWLGIDQKVLSKMS